MSWQPGSLGADEPVSRVKRHAIRGALATFGSQIIRFVLQFGSQLVLARLLDPADFGLVAMAAPVMAFVATINDLGFGQAVVQRPEITSAQVSSLFWVNATISVALTAVAGASAPLFAYLYGDRQIMPIIEVLSVLILVNGLSIVPSAVINRDMRFVRLASVDVVSLVIGTAAAILGALYGLRYWSLVAAQVATSTSFAVMLWTFARWRPLWPAWDKTATDMIGFGAHLTGANLATYFSTSADNILVGAVAGKYELGLYDRSYRLTVQPLGQILAPINRVAVPVLSRMHGSSDPGSPDRYRRTYVLMVQLTLFVTLPALLVNILLAKPIVVFLFGAQWVGSAPIFAAICVGGLASSLYASAAWLFVSQGRTAEQMRVSVVTSLINVASFGIGVSHGALGVAAVSGVSFACIQTPIMLRAATRAGPVGARDLRRAVQPFAVSALACAASLLLIAAHLQHVSLAAVFLCELLSYGAATAALMLMPSGRRFLREVLHLRGAVRG